MRRENFYDQFFARKQWSKIGDFLGEEKKKNHFYSMISINK